MTKQNQPITVDDDKVIDYIQDKIKDTKITRKDIEMILDYELEYLVEIGVAER